MGHKMNTDILYRIIHSIDKQRKTQLVQLVEEKNTAIIRYNKNNEEKLN